MWGDVLKRLRDSHMTDLFNDPALPGSCGYRLFGCSVKSFLLKIEILVVISAQQSIVWRQKICAI